MTRKTTKKKTMTQHTDSANRDLLILKDEGAPPRVIAAAEAAIASVRCGVPPPLWARDILFGYAAKSNTQNRYGKTQ